MLPRFCLTALVGLVVACGGAESGPTLDPVMEQAGSGGAAAGTSAAGSFSAGKGATDQAGAGGAPGAPTAGASGSTTAAGMAGAGGATAGQPGASGSGAGSGGEAGAAGVGGSAGAVTAGGAAGHAGAPQAGSGGMATDSLEPKPVQGCPGYVAVRVPHATCVWFHGDFKFQNQQCNVGEPAPRACAIASAPGMETTSYVSEGVQITRFDFNETGCPKACP